MSPDRSRVLMEGLITGLIGYAAVALFFGVANLLGGHSFFHTAAWLGRGLVAADPAGRGALEAGPVLAWNGLHLLVFLLIGLVAAWLTLETERHPSIFVLVFFVALGGFFLNLAAFFAISAQDPAALPWWTVVGANLLAGVGMGTYLLKVHPRLWETIRRLDADPETEHPMPR